MNFKRYFEFDGVSTRSEYWAINLICYVGLVLSAILSLIFTMSGILGMVSGIMFMMAACVVLVWLVFSVTIRRCRDIGISPWFTAALLIPYIAFIPFIVFGCLKSEVKDEHTCC